MSVRAQQFLDAVGHDEYITKTVESNGLKADFKIRRLPYLELAKIEALMLDGKSNFSPEGSAEIRPHLIAACVIDVDDETGNEAKFTFEEVANWKNAEFIKALGEACDEVNGRNQGAKAAKEARKNS